MLNDGHSAAIGSTPAVWTGRKVVFGIRPEAVQSDPEVGLPCLVSLVEPTGSETHLIAHAGHTEIVVVLKERMRIHEGDTVKFSFDTAQAHFFDPESGQRLAAAEDRTRSPRRSAMGGIAGLQGSLREGLQSAP